MRKEIKLAKLFHDTYERLAPSYGYETRKETREFDENSKNGQLMIATCKEILDKYEKKSYEEIIKDLFDKYFNYKNAWEELKDQQTAYITKFLDKFGSVETKTLNQLIKELEQKHGIEVE